MENRKPHCFLDEQKKQQQIFQQLFQCFPANHQTTPKKNIYKNKKMREKEDLKGGMVGKGMML